MDLKLKDWICVPEAILCKSTRYRRKPDKLRVLLQPPEGHREACVYNVAKAGGLGIGEVIQDGPVANDIFSLGLILGLNLSLYVVMEDPKLCRLGRLPVDRKWALPGDPRDQGNGIVRKQPG